jgi:hypothetical protein
VNIVAKYYLHDRLKRQEFFVPQFKLKCLDTSVPGYLARSAGHFLRPRAQIIISGAQTGVDLEDLRRNT